MKFALVFLAIFATAFAKIEEWNYLDQVSPNRKIEDTTFRPGREYHYFYNGQLATGVAGASKQHSANRIQALVQISMKTESEVILTLQNVRMGRLNRQIPNPRRMMPFDAFEDAPIEQHLKQKLELPLKFSYSNGLVRDLEFDSREDPWSSNVKRGVLNLLQVNLQQHRKIESPEESKLSKSRSERVSENENTQFFRVMEETLEGECETLYSVQSQPHRRTTDSVLNVTKSINFEKCNKRPQIKYNFRFAVKNPSADASENEQEEEKFLKSSTVVQYNITGDKNQFLIESARTESQYVFTPFNEETNVIVTYVNQTFVLIKTGPIQHVQQPQNPIKSDSNMVFTLDWSIAHEKFSMQGGSQSNNKYLQNGVHGINKQENVKKILKKVVSQMKEQVDEELPQQFTNLISWLRQCDHQELEHFVRMQEGGQFSTEEERKLKNIIPQALGICGTKDCLKHLTQKIRQGQIGPLRGALALKSLLHSRAVSKEMIQEIMQLAESEKARESEILKRTAFLTVGSLINALCADNEDQLAIEIKEDARKLCGREQKDSFVKILFDKFRQANKWQDKVLVLKTIGNAGLDLSIFELEKIVRQQDASYPMYVRLEAILAMRGLKYDMPKKIQRILMPIVMNRREYPTLRSIAAYMLLETQPERPILDQLARNLIDEPSHQFASFVYTQLHSYANSTNPYEKQLSSDAKLALRQAKKINTGLAYSRFNHFTFHSENQQVGLDLDIGTIFSNVSAIPRHAGIAVHTSRLGYLQKLLGSISMYTEGLEPLIREFAGDRFLLSKSLSNSLTDMFQRHPRNTRGQNSNENNEYERELDEIFTKHLKIRHRQYNDEYENEPKAYLSTMYKSQTVAVLPLGKEILQQVVQEGRSKIGEVIQKLQRGVQFDYSTVAQLHDLHLRIPTTLGLQLSVSIQAPIAVSVKGRVQANMESKNVKVQAELKPSAVITSITDVQAWSPVVVSGVKYQIKAKLFAPVDAKVDVEMGPNPQIKAQIKPPTQKRDLVILESRPITYTHSWQEYLKNPESSVSKDELTIPAEEINRLKTINKCAGRETLGFDLCVRGQTQCTPGESVTGTPFGPLTGQAKLVITSQASEGARDIEIKINAQRQSLNGNDMHRPAFSFAGRQSPFQDGSESSSSSTSEEEDSQQRESQQGSQQTSAERRHSQRQQQQQRQRQSQSQSQRSQHNNNVFEQYRKYQVKSGYKTQLNVEVKTASDKRVNMELNHVFDAKRRYGKIDFRMQSQHPQQWQACFDAELMLPEQPEFINDVKEKKAVAHAQLRWGQSCSSQNYIQITTQAQRSTQQMQWEQNQNQYRRYNSKQECKNNKGWCSPLTQEDFVEKIGHMLKYRLDIDYRNVPSTVQNVTNKLYRALKHYYYWQTDVDQINVQNQQNQIRAEVVLDAQTKQRLNVTIRMPHESVKIQDMPLRQPLFTLNQKQPFGQQLRNYFENKQENDDQSECSVTGKTGWQRRSQIETFDGTKFSAPFTNCWVVLSKDCGSSKPEFVVMARKSEQSSTSHDLKEVKIVTRSHRIQLTPETDEYDSVKVTVNGKPYNPDTDADIQDHGHVVTRIEKEGKTINVELPEVGVEVEFDGYAINVKLSEYYQGQQCGLCGHFDKESADEFRNPDFTQESDLRQFYLNYLIKDDRCQAPKQLSEICQDEDCDQDRSSSGSSSSSSSESGSASSSGSGSSSSEDNDNDETTEKPTHKTKVVELDDKICFSMVPVPQCDDDSYPMQVKEQKSIQYTCLDQNSESAEEFERKARQGKKTIQGLSNRQPNFTRTENIPEKCKKYKN